VGSVGKGRTSRLGLGEQRVHISPGRHHLTDAELAGLRRSERDLRVLRQLCAGVQGKDEPVLQLEHRHSPRGALVVTGELGADHPRRIQPKAAAVELERPIEVAYRQGDHTYARVHLFLL